MTMPKSRPGEKPIANRMPNSRTRSSTLTKSVLKMPAATSSMMMPSRMRADATFIAMKPASSGWLSYHGLAAAGETRSARRVATSSAFRWSRRKSATCRVSSGS